MSPVNAAWVQRVAVGLIQLQRQWGMALHVQPLLTGLSCSFPHRLRRPGGGITTLWQAQIYQHGQRRGE